MSEAKTLKLAVRKARELPEEAQESIGRELLVRVHEIEEMRKAVALGIQQLDRGEGIELDIEDVIAEARRRHAKK